MKDQDARSTLRILTNELVALKSEVRLLKTRADIAEQRARDIMEDAGYALERRCREIYRLLGAVRVEQNSHELELVESGVSGKPATGGKSK